MYEILVLLVRTYQELGRFDDALAEFQRVEESLRDWPVSIAARGFVAGIAGRTDQAQSVLSELKRLAAPMVWLSSTPVSAKTMRPLRGSTGRSMSGQNWMVWLRLDPC
jgi:hypothetical protein